MNALPIYLLVNGEADGPHEERDVTDRISRRKLAIRTLSATEGMPGWRTIPETLVWSRGGLLSGIRAEVRSFVDRMARQETDVRYARADIMRMIGHRGDCTIDESLTTLLTVNATLQTQHGLYSRRESDWNYGSSEFWPAFQLIKQARQHFLRDWPADWTKAGGRSFGKRMAARRDDPVWARFSDFGFPFPPFSMDTGMWIESVSFDEARAFGLDVPRGPFGVPELRKTFDLVGIPGL